MKVKSINQISFFLSFAIIIGYHSIAQNKELDRTILPIPHPVPAPITEPDVRKAKMPPHYEHNFFGLTRYKATSKEKIAAGKHSIVFHFVPDDPKKLGSGGKGVITVDGKQVAEVITPKMVYGVFSFDDGLSIGSDEETNVSLDYKEGDNKFTGKIFKVTISVL